MYRLSIITFIMIFGMSFAVTVLADDLKKASAIASQGTRFQAERLKIAAENIANEDSTGASPGADAYRRKVIFAENRYSKEFGTNVIATKKITTDKSDFIMQFDPHHPAANADGYVKYPNITREIERADAAEAQRGYEANLSVMEVTSSLLQKTVEVIGR